MYQFPIAAMTSYHDFTGLRQQIDYLRVLTVRSLKCVGRPVLEPLGTARGESISCPFQFLEAALILLPVTEHFYNLTSVVIAPFLILTFLIIGTLMITLGPPG